MTFDAGDVGTDAERWHRDPRFGELAPLEIEHFSSVTVVAAHPDDETLGAGGLIAECSRLGITVTVIIITDGARSNPESPTHSTTDIAKLRENEVRSAVRILDAAAPVVMLHHPDGCCEENKVAIESDLRDALSAGTVVVAPWRGDGHRDHRVVGEICAKIANSEGRTLLEYPIWMWHWATPDDDRVPWGELRSLPLGASTMAAKRAGVVAHNSQVAGLGPEPGNGAVLRPEFLRNFLEDSELFVTSRRAESAIPRSYFDRLYAQRDDPWRLSTRWYEERKRAITMASLPDRRYARALEIGSSVGTLTERLATRCDDLLSVDISERAVELATARTAQLHGVHVQQLDVTTDFPPGRFDLVVLSEVGYYWSASVLARMARTIREHLSANSVVVACHWRRQVDDYLLSGDEVNRIIRDEGGLAPIASHVEEDFRIDVLSADDRSVAQREGFVP